ncbi:hypothetical protein DHEL01_v204596 [Diaporthe helianthi]|uniref:Heterokaryon incompatibility domain-containing protein n=1 Tax=Diaporthe helianthi TaxID=158607 RepID=A0A2P5I3D1_DIAHE|nr:hypothetical protein DHEL01_v204596 [Diaporthe helianthi]
MSIGANLHSALPVLRPRDVASIRVIWVDSICIYQADVRERNHQVHMMKHINSKAASVVVWLWLDNAASQAAMDLTLRCHKKLVVRHLCTMIRKDYGLLF